MKAADRDTLDDTYKKNYLENDNTAQQLLTDPAKFWEKVKNDGKKFTISEWVGFVNPKVDKDS